MAQFQYFLFKCKFPHHQNFHQSPLDIPGALQLYPLTGSPVTPGHTLVSSTFLRDAYTEITLNCCPWAPSGRLIWLLISRQSCEESSLLSSVSQITDSGYKIICPQLEKRQKQYYILSALKSDTFCFLNYIFYTAHMEATGQLVSRFSCSTSWVPGIKLRLLGLAVSIYPLSHLSDYHGLSFSITNQMVQTKARFLNSSPAPVKPSLKKKKPNNFQIFSSANHVGPLKFYYHRYA